MQKITAEDKNVGNIRVYFNGEYLAGCFEVEFEYLNVEGPGKVGYFLLPLTYDPITDGPFKEYAEGLVKVVRYHGQEIKITFKDGTMKYFLPVEYRLYKSRVYIKTERRNRWIRYSMHRIQEISVKNVA